jgi:hypothetical protein
VTGPRFAVDDAGPDTAVLVNTNLLGAAATMSKALLVAPVRPLEEALSV